MGAEAGPIGRVDPRHRLVALGFDRRPAARQNRLARGEPPDGDGPHVVGVAANEVAVDAFVVLTVVADQQPADARELACEALETDALVLGPAAEPAVSSSGPRG